jgi:hypothetical protein
MLWLKACPKCGGDLQEGKDRFGPYLACIQCGCYVNDKAIRVLARSRGSGQIAGPSEDWRVAS